jgi:hypothetical protein
MDTIVIVLFCIVFLIATMGAIFGTWAFFEDDNQTVISTIVDAQKISYNGNLPTVANQLALFENTEGLTVKQSRIQDNGSTLDMNTQSITNASSISTDMVETKELNAPSIISSLLITANNVESKFLNTGPLVAQAIGIGQFPVANLSLLSVENQSCEIRLDTSDENDTAIKFAKNGNQQWKIVNDASTDMLYIRNAVSDDVISAQQNGEIIMPGPSLTLGVDTNRFTINEGRGNSGDVLQTDGQGQTSWSRAIENAFCQFSSQGEMKTEVKAGITTIAVCPGATILSTSEFTKISLQNVIVEYGATDLEKNFKVSANMSLFIDATEIVTCFIVKSQDSVDFPITTTEQKVTLEPSAVARSNLVISGLVSMSSTAQLWVAFLSPVDRSITVTHVNFTVEECNLSTLTSS